MYDAKTLGILSAFVLVGCPASDDKATAGDTGAPPAEICFQQDGVDNGQIGVIEDAVILDSTTWAVTPAAATDPATALPGGFEPAEYYGAVNPEQAVGWFDEWTVGGDFDGSHSPTPFHPLQDEIEDGTITPAAKNACQALDTNYADGGTTTIFGETFPVCVVSQPITSSVAWPNNHIFILDGTVNVGTGDVRLEGGNPTDNAVLTIQAGTQIYGAEGVASSLAITRGSMIEAEGTVDLPILFASVAVDTALADVVTGDVADVSSRGEWGGVVLSGFGETNSGDDNGELLTEAAPEDAERWYGGTNNADNSGTIRYAIIAESGFEFRPDEEVQGLTIEAAGSGTTLEYIQVLGSEDDCIEWFGGAASIRFTLNNGCDDDGWDQDLGWVGTIQFGLHVHGAENGDRGIESDNNNDNFDAAPQTAPNIANITMIGNVGKGESSAALHREGWRGKVFRSVYTDGDAAWARGCLDVDDALPPALEYRDVLFNCANGALLECDDS
ncbi:MAG: hypothetical protein AAF602_21490 [Myxococcota bacterium]